jgi:diacylglycerol kinase (ATP)
MRAAAILGLGSSIRDLKPFEGDPNITWALGLPAAGSVDVVLIFGGDGTVHRHLGSLVKLGAPVLVVPQGSGNDFARELGIRNLADAISNWQSFVSGAVSSKSIDLGVITALKNGTLSAIDAKDSRPQIVPKHYFCCVAGVGLDGAVSRFANRLPRWLRGHGGYALSLPLGLATFDPYDLTILEQSEIDPNGFRDRYSKSVLLAAFANTSAFGGGMRIAPRASLTDGLLDICIVGKLAKLKLLSHFPMVYMGRHLGIKQVEYFLAKRVRIQTSSPMDVYADGEYVCQTPADVSIEAHALRVIVSGELP